MEVINTTGRRKASIARLYMKAGKGEIKVNGKDYKEYFPQQHIQQKCCNNGNQKGSRLLLSILHKKSYWFQALISAMKDPYLKLGEFIQKFQAVEGKEYNIN